MGINDVNAFFVTDIQQRVSGSLRLTQVDWLWPFGTLYNQSTSPTRGRCAKENFIVDCHANMPENFDDKMARLCVSQYVDVDPSDPASVKAKLDKLSKQKCCHTGCHGCVVTVRAEFRRHLKNLSKIK